MYNVIKCWQFDGNELDIIYLKIVFIHTIESEYIHWRNQIIFIIGLCVDFFSYSYILFGIMFFIHILLIVIIFVLINFLFVPDIFTFIFFLDIIITCLFFLIYCSINILLKIVSIVIIHIVVVSDTIII